MGVLFVIPYWHIVKHCICLQLFSKEEFFASLKAAASAHIIRTCGSLKLIEVCCYIRESDWSLIHDGGRLLWFSSA